jgi:uncharacterized membrane protein
MITNDAAVLGLLFGLLALVFHTASLPGRFWKRFYTYVPPLLLCYFLPGVLNSLGVISGAKSALYPVVSQYFLPTCLVFFTLGMDVRALAELGGKAVLVFLAGTLGVMLGGPLALWIVKNLVPGAVSGHGADATWRGLATIAGSWIGGGANQTALKEVFRPSDRLFSQVVAVDVLTAELWMAVLIYGAGFSTRIDRLFRADSSAIESVRQRLEKRPEAQQQRATVADWMRLGAVGFGATGLVHLLADQLAPYLATHYPALEKYSLTSRFFWVVALVTLLGIGLSFTSARRLERVGASQLGTIFLYVLVATIGMNMDLRAVAQNPALFAVGVLWMTVHAVVILTAAWLLKAPFFFTAVGSQANVGGAASAPVVAAAFHPALAPVGVLLAILGYALGTYCGYLTGLLMQWVSER